MFWVPATIVTESFLNGCFECQQLLSLNHSSMDVLSASNYCCWIIPQWMFWVPATIVTESLLNGCFECQQPLLLNHSSMDVLSASNYCYWIIAQWMFWMKCDLKKSLKHLHTIFFKSLMFTQNICWIIFFIRSCYCWDTLILFSAFYSMIIGFIVLLNIVNTNTGFIFQILTPKCFTY